MHSDKNKNSNNRKASLSLFLTILDKGNRVKVDHVETDNKRKICL